MLLGYARVSTRDQDPTRQVDELTRAGCERVWVDHGVSGTKTSRPKLDALLDHARSGDTIVVIELSRLGRTVRQLVVLVDDLGQNGIGVRSLTQALDTTPGQSGGIGTLLLSLFAALAQLEREVLVDRTLSGLAAARARGRVGGRPTVLPAEKLAAAQALVAAGTSKAEAARALGVSRSTLYRALDRAATAN
ncbi:recombinase family protein [Cellulomonas hominis]